MAEAFDQDEFEDWLRTQTPEVSAAIAFREATRLMPVVFHLDYWDYDWTENLILKTTHCNLISSLARNWPSDEIKGLATAATTAVNVNVITTNAITATAAARAAATAARTATRNDPIPTARAAARAVTATFTTALMFDRNLIEAEHSVDALLKTPLWGDQEAPAELRPQIIEDYAAKNPAFSFWARWFDTVFHARPQNEEMLRAIAKIGYRGWKKGANHIAQLIADIEAEYEKPGAQEPHPDMLSKEAKQKLHSQVKSVLKCSALNALSAEHAADMITNSLTQMSNQIPPEEQDQIKILVTVRSLEASYRGMTTNLRVNAPNIQELEKEVLRLETLNKQLTDEVKHLREVNLKAVGNAPSTGKQILIAACGGAIGNMFPSLAAAAANFLGEYSPELIEALRHQLNDLLGRIAKNDLPPTTSV